MWHISDDAKYSAHKGNKILFLRYNNKIISAFKLLRYELKIYNSEKNPNNK